MASRPHILVDHYWRRHCIIPNIVMQVGIPMALIICAIAVGFTHVSIVMYMRVMASVEIQIETIYDLGYYVVRNRFIVFLIAIILMI